MKIFIVEDDEILLLMLDRMIHKMGHQVIGTATKGSEAINLIPSTNPDLILMDIILKDDINGVTVAENITKIKPYPIIYITGNSETAIKERAQKVGFHDYLIKPTSFEVLHGSISSL